MMMALEFLRSRQPADQLGRFMNQNGKMLGANPVLFSLVLDGYQRNFLAALFADDTLVLIRYHACLLMVDDIE